MNLRQLRVRVVSSVLRLGIVGSLAGLGAHPVLAQSLNVMTPFAFCVNNQPYPRGEYEFTLLSQWLLSVRNAKGGGEKLFRVRPEVAGPSDLAISLVGPLGGVTFRTVQGVKELHAVHERGSDESVVLTGQRKSMDKSGSRGSLEQINCLSDKSSSSGN